MPITLQLPINPQKNARIAIVGEAPGEKEAQLGKPFVGQSGAELTAMLAEAGIVREECLLTNVFMERPPANNLMLWCVGKKEADTIWQDLGNTGKYPFAPLTTGKYMDPRRMGDILRLYKEIIDYKPNIIIALGNTPLWALTGSGGISKVRGTVVQIELDGHTFKLIPTYHPSYILRTWADRPIVVADLMKANRESVTPEYTRSPRELWLEPSIADIAKFAVDHLYNAPHFAADIETAKGQITCIGFGTRTHAICIPFVDERKPGWNYWESPAQEVIAWKQVKTILQAKGAKIFQNGMYDMQWLWKKMGITPSSPVDDTMLLGHSMFPEMQKSLGFFGSIYTNETSWKKMRPKKNKTSKAAKKDDAE